METLINIERTKNHSLLIKNKGVPLRKEIQVIETYGVQFFCDGLQNRVLEPAKREKE